MTPGYLNRNQYINFVAGVANQHNCKLVKVNLPERIIDIEGTPEALYACSVELEKLLGRHTADQPA